MTEQEIYNWLHAGRIFETIAFSCIFLGLSRVFLQAREFVIAPEVAIIPRLSRFRMFWWFLGRRKLRWAAGAFALLIADYFFQAQVATAELTFQLVVKSNAASMPAGVRWAYLFMRPAEWVLILIATVLLFCVHTQKIVLMSISGMILIQMYSYVNCVFVYKGCDFGEWLKFGESGRAWGYQGYLWRSLYENPALQICSFALALSFFGIAMAYSWWRSERWLAPRE